MIPGAASRRPRGWRREVLEEGCRAENAESPPGPGGGSESRLHPGRIRGCSAAAEVLWLCPSAAGRAREGLYDVLGAGQRPLRRARVWLPVQLRQLQHRHVTQGTHLPHLQPLDEAPADTGDTLDISGDTCDISGDTPDISRDTPDITGHT